MTAARRWQSCQRLLACLAFVGCALATSVQASPFQFSACVHLALGRSDAATVDAALKRGGLDAFRDDVYWDAVEQREGELVLTAPLKQVVDAARLARARGARPLIILSYGNRHHDNGGLVVTEAGRTAFERYARFVVRQFGDLVDQYEVWNEWSAGFGSKPRQSKGDAGLYVQLLASTARAIKEENPRATVVGGAVAGLDFAWINAFLAAGGLDHLDAFSVHSYTLFQFRDNPESAIRGLDLVHAALQRAQPGRQVPILVTEMGWPTHAGRRGVSEALAARYLVRFMLLARSRPWIGGVWWYDLFDDGDNPVSMEHRFGLLRRQGQPKPAFEAARRIAPWLRSATAPHAYGFPAGGVLVHGRHEGKDWVVAWRVEPGLLSWVYAMPDAVDAPDELKALADAVEPDGEPVFWHKESTEWTRTTPQ